MNRREFCVRLPAAAAILGSYTAGAGAQWPIGCFNRPWTKWSFDETLDGIRDAGYGMVGLLTPTREEQFIRSKATPEYLEGLKKRIAARGLKVNFGSLGTVHEIPVEESVRDACRQIDNAAALGIEHAMTFGVSRAEQEEHFLKVMAQLAPYVEKRGVKLVIKPHGGISAASTEILRSLEKVGHPNFKIWYDAGNIIHYTGKDPVAELVPIARHVTGFCAKDCGQVKGDVMIQFGTGKVDFKAVFSALKEAGFNGPIMVECCALSASRETVNANARENRLFLEKTLAQL